MRRPRRTNGLVIALYINAALLLAILIAVMSNGGGMRFPSVLPAAYAAAPAAPQPIAGGGGLYLMPGQFTATQWGCYILDTDAQTLAAYRWFEGDKKLRLIAARSFKNDRKLQNFNTDTPTPDEVAKLLKLEQSGRRDNPDASSKPENDAAPGEEPQK